MPKRLKGKKVLMIVAPRDFRDEELFEPKGVLEKAGAQVKVASKGVATARGMFGREAAVDVDIGEVDVDEWDAIVFVGGTGSSIYFEDEKALAIAREAHEKGKVLAAICIAPSTLANAGVLEGKKATAWPSEEANLKAKGAIYTGELVTRDGKTITAKGPMAAREFGEEIAKALS